jgi:hypothetical protein
MAFGTPNAADSIMRTKRLAVVYWIVTGLFVLGQGFSVVQYLREAPRMVETITGLGYPIYFMKILAVAKILGIIAILYGRPAVLKEWAYAGFTFDVLGAFSSHLASGDRLYVAAVPLIFLALQLASYLLWKRLQGERPRVTTPKRSAEAGPLVPKRV